MDVRLVRNENPLWTMDFIDHIANHGDAYGWPSTPEEVEAERKLVRKGLARRRHAGESWEVLVVGDVAGEVVLVDNGKSRELSMVVFERFSGRGVGEQALQAFLSEFDRWPLEAVVRRDNVAQSRIVEFLIRNGFRVYAGVVGIDNVSLIRDG